MKRSILILAALFLTLILSACGPILWTAPEGTPHDECAKVCQDIYDDAEEYLESIGWEGTIRPGNAVGACAAQCQTGKYTAFKSQCGEDWLLDFFENKKACQNYFDGLK